MKHLPKQEGKYIARMDADDVSLLDRFENQYAHMEANPIVSLLEACYTVFNEYGSTHIVAIPSKHVKQKKHWGELFDENKKHFLWKYCIF